MTNNISNLKEETVQKLIADYPWLLNIDYEIVSGLKNKGMEYILSGNKRADLILRDRISGRPVIVEFKAVNFYRENIGQILDYKARVISESTNEKSLLKDIFKDKIFSPIMILVVPSCDAEARLACNLSGIEIYEYDKTIPQILVPDRKTTLEEFKKNFNSKDIPFNMDRNKLVDKVYSDILSVLNEENISEGWTGYKNASGEYFSALNHLFVNKWLFKDNKISIGIYEFISDSSKLDKVVIDYFSYDKDLLMKFIDKYRELNISPQNNSDYTKNEKFGEYYWSFHVDKKEFFDKTKETIKSFIKNYKNIVRNYPKLFD